MITDIRFQTVESADRGTRAEALGTHPTFYHGSEERFPVGFVLKPQSDGYVYGDCADGFSSIERDTIEQTEKILERYRPRDVISRRSAVFLVDQPDPDLIERAGGYADFIYGVEPIGTVWKTNLHWYSEVYSFAEGMSDAEVQDVPGLRVLASNYWKAAPSERYLWEYLCASANVLKIVRC